MRGALLVSNQHVLDLFLLEELVVDVEHRAARIAEDVFHAFLLQTTDDDFRTGELHGITLREKVDPLAQACARAPKVA